MDMMRIMLGLLWMYFSGMHDIHSHVHIESVYINGNLVIRINDFLNGIYPVEQYKMTVPGEAMVEAGRSGAMAQFISDGQYVCWLLPQNEDPRFIYLGFSTSGAGSGLFEGNRVRMRIRDVRGPGGAHGYTVGAFSDIQVLWSNADGIGDEDTFTIGAPGGHIHCNWLFTQPGNYQIDMECNAVVRSSRQTISSNRVTLFFKVEPPDPGLKILRNPNSAGHLDIEFQTKKSVRYHIFQSPEIGFELSHWVAFSGNPIVGTGEIIRYPIDDIQTGDSKNQKQFFHLHPIYAQP
jgi:surface-anchored protein